MSDVDKLVIRDCSWYNTKRFGIDVDETNIKRQISELTISGCFGLVDKHVPTQPSVYGAGIHASWLTC